MRANLELDSWLWKNIEKHNWESLNHPEQLIEIRNLVMLPVRVHAEVKMLMKKKWKKVDPCYTVTESLDLSCPIVVSPPLCNSDFKIRAENILLMSVSNVKLLTQQKVNFLSLSRIVSLVSFRSWSIVCTQSMS